jgi:hypothetical protein
VDLVVIFLLAAVAAVVAAAKAPMAPEGQQRRRIQQALPAMDQTGEMALLNFLPVVVVEQEKPELTTDVEATVCSFPLRESLLIMAVAVVAPLAVV